VDGRFAAGDANLYRYVVNSPTNFTDPSGLAGVAIQDALPGAGVIAAPLNAPADPIAIARQAVGK
jgi:hypothetical protein